MYQRLCDETYYKKFYFQDSFYAQCIDVYLSDDDSV